MQIPAGMSPTQYINELNIRILRNEEVTDEELEAAIQALRDTRGKAVEAAAGKSSAPKKATKQPVDLAALFAPKKKEC